MTLKKILTGALIGAFVLGISAGNIQTVNAAPSNNGKAVADKFDKDSNGNLPPDMNNNDRNSNNNDRNSNNRPPEPPKDKNGNPMPPPDMNDNDRNSNNRPPEPPKDKNGNPMPPLDMNDNDRNSNRDR